MSPAKFKFSLPFGTFCHNLRFSLIIQKQRKLIKVFVPGDGTSLFPDGCPKFRLWRWWGSSARNYNKSKTKIEDAVMRHYCYSKCKSLPFSKTDCPIFASRLVVVYVTIPLSHSILLPFFFSPFFLLFSPPSPLQPCQQCQPCCPHHLHPLRHLSLLNSLFTRPILLDGPSGIGLCPSVITSKIIISARRLHRPYIFWKLTMKAIIKS